MVFGVCPKAIRDHAPTSEVGNPVFAAIGQSQGPPQRFRRWQTPMGGRLLGSHLLAPHSNHQLQSWSNPRAVTPGLPVSIARASTVAALPGRHSGNHHKDRCRFAPPLAPAHRLHQGQAPLWSASQLLEGRSLFATAAIDADFPGPPCPLRKTCSPSRRICHQNI